MRLDHRQLRAFLQIAELGSVCRAAKELHLTQPALSRLIREFERSCGVVLFERYPLGMRLTEAGQATQERLWRMPLGPEYDKLIESKNADMKNIGCRYGGAIIAAQFLQRFVKETPWAHLDIAGTAIGAPSSETNQSWGSGFGVRLLDRLVRDHYEG